jgi:hypothetical protein
MKLASILVGAVVLAAAAVACGGDGDDNGDAQPTQAASQATQPSGQTTQASPTRAAGATAVPTSPSGQALPTIASGSGALAFDACRLFTRQEASTALGVPVGEPDGFSLGNQTVAPGVTVTVSSCSFTASSGGNSVAATFWRASGTGAAQMRQAMEQVLCQGKERVQGLGDLACWYDELKNEILAIKGSTFVDISLDGVTTGRADALRTLVQQALARVQ